MAQKPERRVEMQKIERSPSRRDALFALFPLFACFANHRMAGSGLRMKAFGPSRRFSSWLWRFGRSAQLLQKGGHGPTHLRQCGKRVASLPRAITSLQQRTSQHQQIVRASHDLRPACAALRRTEPWLIPEQLLFVKTIAMLLRIAQAIARADVGQRSRGITLPDKPTDPGITRLVTGSIADDLNHRELDVASRAQVQVLPTAHLDARSFGIHPFPALIRFAMAVLVFALEALPILATGSQLMRQTLWSRTVEDAVTFDPQQASRLDVGQARQEGRTSVPAVTDNDGMQAASQQQGDDGPQLARRHLCGQFTGSHARRVHNEGGLPGAAGQEYHVTEDPAGRGGVRVLGQIGDGNQRAIRGGFGLGAVQVAGVYPQKNPLPCRRQGREVDKELAQLLGIDLPVFQSLVQAGPAALKKRRERQFGEATGCPFTGERIHQIEQGVPGVAKAAVHPVTKVLQCVKVHQSNAPQFDAFGYITPLSNSCKGIAELTLV